MKMAEGVKLLSILLIDEVESVRVKALAGLEKMAEEEVPEAVEVLERLTNENPYGLWADKLIEKMTSGLNKDEKESVKLDEEVLKNPSSMALAALYSDTNELRMAAIQKLTADDGDEESAAMILDRLKLEKDYRVVASAVFALGQAKGDKEAKVRALQSYLDHHNERVRANAIEALVNLTDSRDRMFMVKCLDDTSNRVQGNAIVALWDTFKNRTEKALDALIQSPHKVCQMTAVYCIGELADWKLAKPCRVLLQSKYPEVSEKMEQTMEHLRDIAAYAKVLEQWKRSHKERDIEEVE